MSYKTALLSAAAIAVAAPAFAQISETEENRLGPVVVEGSPPPIEPRRVQRAPHAAEQRELAAAEVVGVDGGDGAAEGPAHPFAFAHLAVVVGE